MLGEIAGWVAPIATMLAACLTAGNFGTRVTGWGFVVFTIGSIAWVAIGLTTDQPNLLWSNGFLTLVNLVGIYRWLIRRAAFEDGARAAVERSRRAPAPSLFPVGRLLDGPVCVADGSAAGHVVDAMAECGSGRISYVMVSEGGTAGVGERLHAVPWADVAVEEDRLKLALDAESLRALPEVDPRDWPRQPPR